MLVLQRSLFLGDFSSPDCGCLWVFCLALFYLIFVVVEVFHFSFSSFVRRAMFAFYEQRAPVYTFPCHLEVGQVAEQLWLLFSNLCGFLHLLLIQLELTISVGQCIYMTVRRTVTDKEFCHPSGKWRSIFSHRQLWAI